MEEKKEVKSILAIYIPNDIAEYEITMSVDEVREQFTQFSYDYFLLPTIDGYAGIPRYMLKTYLWDLYSPKKTNE